MTILYFGSRVVDQSDKKVHNVISVLVHAVSSVLSLLAHNVWYKFPDTSNIKQYIIKISH